MTRDSLTVPRAANSPVVRKPWSWGKWYGQYVERGEFPLEFGDALLILFRSVKKSYPATFYGPWKQDKVQDVLLSTVKAIVNCKTLRKNYREWNDRQLCGYVRAIIEGKIRERRKKDHPSYFWMLDRINALAERQQLTLIDESVEAYVPSAWVDLTKIWKLEIPETIDTKLRNVSPLTEKIPKNVPTKIIEKTIWALFDAAAGPVPLRELIVHSLRLLGIDDRAQIPLESLNPMDGDRDPTPRESNGREIPTGTFGLEMEVWLRGVLEPLSVEHLLVLFCRTCEKRTLEETAKMVRDILGLSSFCLQTVSNRELEAIQMMGGENLCDKKPALPVTTEERQILCHLFRACIEERLRTLGVSLGNI